METGKPFLAEDALRMRMAVVACPGMEQLAEDIRESLKRHWDQISEEMKKQGVPSSKVAAMVADLIMTIGSQLLLTALYSESAIYQGATENIREESPN